MYVFPFRSSLDKFRGAYHRSVKTVFADTNDYSLSSGEEDAYWIEERGLVTKSMQLRFNAVDGISPTPVQK